MTKTKKPAKKTSSVKKPHPNIKTASTPFGDVNYVEHGMPVSQLSSDYSKKKIYTQSDFDEALNRFREANPPNELERLRLLQNEQSNIEQRIVELKRDLALWTAAHVRTTKQLEKQAELVKDIATSLTQQ